VAHGGASCGATTHGGGTHERLGPVGTGGVGAGGTGNGPVSAVISGGGNDKAGVRAPVPGTTAVEWAGARRPDKDRQLPNGAVPWHGTARTRV